MTDSKSLLPKPWQKFFLQFSEHQTVPIENWKPIHILGYFSVQYEKHYKRSYVFSYEGQPSKCFEIVMIKKLFAVVDSTKPEEVKKYLDWIFECKIKPKNYQMRSMSFLLSPGFGNEFRLWRQSNHSTVISSNSSLPLEIKSLAEKENFGFPLQTYSDLAQFHRAYQSEPSYFPSAPQFFSALQKINFDIQSLEQI
jgi:hypothetical protein